MFWTGFFMGVGFMTVFFEANTIFKADDDSGWDFGLLFQLCRQTTGRERLAPGI
jgi:hypothetical protein